MYHNSFGLRHGERNKKHSVCGVHFIYHLHYSFRSWGRREVWYSTVTCDYNETPKTGCLFWETVDPLKLDLCRVSLHAVDPESGMVNHNTGKELCACDSCAVTMKTQLNVTTVDCWTTSDPESNCPPQVVLTDPCVSTRNTRDNNNFHGTNCLWAALAFFLLGVVILVVGRCVNGSLFNCSSTRSIDHAVSYRDSTDPSIEIS